MILFLAQCKLLRKTEKIFWNLASKIFFRFVKLKMFFKDKSVFASKI